MAAIVTNGVLEKLTAINTAANVSDSGNGQGVATSQVVAPQAGGRSMGREVRVNGTGTAVRFRLPDQ